MFNAANALNLRFDRKVAELSKDHGQNQKPIPDPSCKKGVMSPDMQVCCTDECGSCGNHDLCDDEGKYHEATGKLAGNCCKKRILEKAVSCDKDHAPCVLSPSYKEALSNYVMDKPKRHAMDDCNKAVDIARAKHDMGIDKGDFLAKLYFANTRYKEARSIAIKVEGLCADKTSQSKSLVTEYAAKIAKATPGDKVKDPMSGVSQLDKWENKKEDEEAEITFYDMITGNANEVDGDAMKGMANEKLLKNDIMTYKGRDIGNEFRPKIQKMMDHSDKVLKHAKELWQQWLDSSKDYSCGPPPVVANVDSQCADGNTKYSRKCNIVCSRGYDGEGTSNELRCNKMGKFGKQLYGEWQGLAACVGRSCGLPQKIPKTKTIIQDIRYPNAASYVCYEGFSMNSSALGDKAFSIECDATGNFAKNASHVCKAINCGVAPPMKNTHPISDDYVYTEVAHYKCLEGFTTNGLAGGLTSFIRVCQATGAYTEGIGCKPVRCGPPPDFENTIEPSTTQDQYFGDKLSFECRPGYSLTQQPSGPVNFALDCQANGEFGVEGASGDVPMPVCRAVSAGMAPSIPHGNFQPREMFYGEAALVTADEGYSITGNPGDGITFWLNVTTQGTYAGREEFKPVVCGKLSVEKAKTSFSGDAVYKDILSFACEDGYSTDKTAEPDSAAFTVQCEADADFSTVPHLGKCVNIDDCADHTCGPFGKCVDHLMNYTCNCNSGYEQRFDDETNELVCGNIDDCGPEACGVGECIDLTNDYKCNCPTGYEQKDETNAEGETDHTCRAVICGIPPQVDHASTEPVELADTKASYGSQILYACAEGHTLDGSATGKNHFSIECQASKAFTEQKTCEPIKCDNVPQVAHAAADKTKATFNQSVRFDCATGTSVDGTADGDRSFSITCQSTGTFGEAQACKPISCGQPDDVPNANRPSDSLVYEESVKYHCFEGFTLDGEKDGPTEFEAKCQENGKLTKLDQCLPKVCGHPEDEINVLWASTKDEGAVHYPSSTDIICKDGYTVGGDAGGKTSFVVRCMASGEFERVDERTCQPVKCGAPPKMQNAALKKISTPTPPKPGLTRTVFYNVHVTGSMPDLFGKKPEVADVVPNINIASTQNPWPDITEKDNFAARYSGGLKIEDGGKYHFRLTSDDGSTLYIDGELVIDNGGLHGMKSKESSLELDAGPHALTVEYFEKGGGAGIKLEWKGAGAGDSWTIVPESAFETKGGNLNYEEKAEYECLPGYTTGGEWNAPTTYHVECLPSGELNGPTEENLCRNVDDCSQHTCGPKGVCIDLVGPAPAYTCNCSYGYEIQTSSNGEKYCGNKDDCQGQDCGVGVCKDLVGDYTCICPTGHRIDFKDGKKTCVPVRCVEETPSLEHGQLKSDHSGAVDFPTTLRYECDTGYSVDGTVPESMRRFQAQCKDDGQLFGMKTCQKITCGTPHVVPYTKLLVPSSPQSSVEYKDKAKYECLEGYTIGGGPEGSTSFEVECEDDGVLTAPEVCEPVRCGTAPSVPNTRPAISGSVYFGQHLVYNCDQGYTLDSTIGGQHAFERQCKRDGSFSALSSSEPCKPISPGNAPSVGNADMAEYAGESVESFPPRIFYPQGLEYRCKPGYSTTGALSGPTKITTRVRSDGSLWPQLPSECKKIEFSVSGRVKNAQSGGYMAGVRITIQGSSNGVTSEMGIFTLSNVPGGTLTFVYEKDGFITTTREISVEGNIRSGGVADVSMSPSMSTDEWRAVVKWGPTPSDLDTYGKWGYSTCYYGGSRRSASGITAKLEVDQTRGYGPETLYLSGVGSCSGSSSSCDIHYQINDYTRTSSMLAKAQAEVTLYNGDRVAGNWKIQECAGSVRNSGNWWDVFIIDGKTNRLKWSCTSGPQPVDLMLSNRTSRLKGGWSRLKHTSKSAEMSPASSRKPQLRIRGIDGRWRS